MRSSRSSKGFALLAVGALLVGSGCNSHPTAATRSESPAAATATKPVVQHTDAAGAARMLAENKAITVLDVRTPDEFAAGHIEGARNIDFRSPEFASKLESLDRNGTYVVHCAAGGRSTSSLATFEKLGFKSVIHLDGGFNGWTEAGKPVAK